MDAMTLVLPVLGIAAAAAVTFYAVSFSEIREVVSALFSKSQHLFLRLSFGKKKQKSFADLEDDELENKGSFPSTASSRKTRARRKAEKEARKREP